MARWSPGSEDRLRRAALELFSDRGYDAVTAADIAEHAGLTRRSFFRHFPDKREVLFGDASRLLIAIESNIGSAAADRQLVEVVVDVLAEVGTTLLGMGDQALRRRVIDSSHELLERERTKTSAIGAAIARGAARREVQGPDAALLGGVMSEVFRIAYSRAALDPAGTAFPEELRRDVARAGTFLASSTGDIRTRGC